MGVNSNTMQNFSIFIINREEEDGFDLKEETGELILFNTDEIKDLILVIKNKHLAKQNKKARKTPLQHEL
jgi:hypothetical protein